MFHNYLFSTNSNLQCFSLSAVLIIAGSFLINNPKLILGVIAFGVIISLFTWAMISLINKLAELFKELANMGIKCVLSNNYTEYIQELYKDYTIIVLNRNNTWGATGKQGKKVPECLILSYKEL